MRLCLTLLALLACRDAQAWTLGREQEPAVVVAADATVTEEEAARQLVHYLGLATGSRFNRQSEGAWDGTGPAILVGPTAQAALLGPDPAGLGPEEWVIKVRDDRLLLYGGRPRGTLYAALRFLEDHVGVRWWTPLEEQVPRLRKLSLPDIERRGSPAFSYRDIFGIRADPQFFVHSRLNGHFSRLPAELGGSERYGPPRHAHTFYDYIPPADYFDEMPELFSLREGMRSAGASQLCLSNPKVHALVKERLFGYIEQARGEPTSRLFSISPNDWGGACACDACMALADRYGGQGGLLVWFIDDIADAADERYPELMLDTLAYGYTFDPPKEVTLRENVVVRFSALQRKEMSRAVTDPANRAVKEALEGWLDAADHLRIWEYAVAYGANGDLPLANLPLLAADFRFYRNSGVEGIFLQHDFPVAADMRPLKLWVLAKLMEDPARDVERLIEEFTEGYYGAAGKQVRRYRRLLARRMSEYGGPIRYTAEASDYGYLDARFLEKAHALFDRGERRIAEDAVLLRRLRHARLSLDRATLWLWPSIGNELTVDRRAVATRYRHTWVTQIALTYPEKERPALMAAVDDELSVLAGRRYNLQPTASEEQP